MLGISRHCEKGIWEHTQVSNSDEHVTKIITYARIKK